MNINDILDRVKRQFGDESGVQVQNADIIRWINDAQNEAVTQHPGLFLASSTVDIEIGEFTIALPTNLLDLQTVEYRESGVDPYISLTYKTTQEMDEYYPGWLDELYLGSPEIFTRGTKGKMRLYPVPDKTLSAGLRLNYSRYAIPVDDVGDAIDLPEYYHTYVLEFCLMKAYEMDEEWEVADRKAAYVQSTLDFNSARESWFGKEVYPSVTPVAEDYI